MTPNKSSRPTITCVLAIIAFCWVEVSVAELTSQTALNETKTAFPGEATAAPHRYTDEPRFLETAPFNKFNAKQLSREDHQQVIELFQNRARLFSEEWSWSAIKNGFPPHYDISKVSDILFANRDLCLDILSSPLSKSLYSQSDQEDIKRLQQIYGPDSGLFHRYQESKASTVEDLSYLYRMRFNNKGSADQVNCSKRLLATIVADMPQLVKPFWDSFYFRTRQELVEVLELMKQEDLFKTVDHNGRSMLHHIAANRLTSRDLSLPNPEELLSYFPNDTSLIEPDVDGRTPIFIAVKEGQFDLANALVAKFDTSISFEFDQSGHSLWHYAAQNNNLDVMRWLMSHGDSNYQAKSAQGDTPLHLAMKENSFKVVPYLLELGTDISVTNADGYSPLKIGYQAKGLSKSVEWILKESQKSPDYRLDNDIIKKIIFHSYREYADLAFFQQLSYHYFEHPCEIFADKDQKHFELLNLICQPALTVAETDFLSSHQADLWVAQENTPLNLTPMHLLAMVIDQPGKEALFSHLLSGEARLSVLDAWGYTVADHLVLKNKPEALFRLLLNKSYSDQNLQPVFTNTIIRAIEADSAEMAAILQLFWFPVYAVDKGVGPRQIIDAGALSYRNLYRPKKGKNVLQHINKHHQWVYQYPGPNGTISPLDAALSKLDGNDFRYADVVQAVGESNYVTQATVNNDQDLLAQVLVDGANPNEKMPFYESYSGLEYLGWPRAGMKQRTWSLMLMFGADVKERGILKHMDWIPGQLSTDYGQLARNYIESACQKDKQVFLEKNQALIKDFAYWKEALGVNVSLSQIHPVCSCLTIQSLGTTTPQPPPSLVSATYYDWFSSFIYREADQQPLPYCQQKASIAGDGFIHKLTEICEEYGYIDIAPLM